MKKEQNLTTKKINMNKIRISHQKTYLNKVSMKEVLDQTAITQPTMKLLKSTKIKT